MRSRPFLRALVGPSTLLFSGLALAAAPAPSPAGKPVPTFDLRVSRIDADVTLDPPRGALHETISMRLEAKGVSRLAFAIDGNLVVQSARPSAGTAEFHQAGSELIVELDPPLDGERTLTFAVKGIPRAPSEIGPLRAVLAPASRWYPELPGTWALTSVVARVPAGWTAIAPGAPDARTAPGVWRWTTTKPVRSIAIAAAPSLKIGEGALVSVPFRIASTAAGPNARTAAERLAPAMAWLSGALAPYPFDAFDLVLLPGWSGRVQAGGMMIAGENAPLSTDSDGADLLTGQWFGEILAGDGAWMEAFAAWEACVFAQDRTLPIPAGIAAERLAYFALRSGDVALAKALPTTPSPVLRGKGSAAPEMVRLIAGDGPTFDAMRALFARPVGPPLTLAEVRASLEARAERSLERAFTDWFERAGAPEIDSSLRSFPAADGGFRADVTLTQRRAAYALPVEIVIYGAGQEHRESVEIADETTSVFYVLPFEPKRLEIDPLNRLFRRR